jgi:hypothetical protein
MAWSPFQRSNAGISWVEQPGDYANLNSNHFRDGTHGDMGEVFSCRAVFKHMTSRAEGMMGHCAEMSEFRAVFAWALGRRHKVALHA